MANFGKIYGGVKTDSSVIAYTADHVLQDMKISYPDGIPADLVAGSVVSLVQVHWQPLQTILALSSLLL